MAAAIPPEPSAPGPNPGRRIRLACKTAAWAILASCWYGCDIDTDGDGGSASLAATTTASTASCIGDACNDATGGGGGFAGFCTGVAASCETFSGSTACFEIPGCDAFTECAGTATDCELLGQAQCSGQIGCYWSYVVDGPAYCAGMAATCPELGSTACESQQGCQVDVECSGSALPCEAIAMAATCALQSGCTWE
jgi:hypothetical protein